MMHLLGIEGLSKEDLYFFLDNAQKFVELSQRKIKKAPALRGKTIINLFLEPSTRTRASFEIAGKRLSADTINISGSGSSTKKGESLRDTALTLQSMAPDAIVLRHSESGACQFLTRYLQNTSIINAGDGMHEHPTQALLDLLTLMQHFQGRQEGIEKLKIAFVGDIRHSRVARSNIWAHALLGNEVRLVGPTTLVPPELKEPNCFKSDVHICHKLEEGIEGADVVVSLRMQLERQSDNFVPSLEEYTRQYCITENLLHRVAPNSVIMHPGPINRGVEITSEVIEGPRALVEQQVSNGVAVRMAVLFLLITGNSQDQKEEELETA